MIPKRLELMLEGESDQKSVPGLVQRVLERHGGHDTLFLGGEYRLGGLPKIICKGNENEFLRRLKSIEKRQDLGAVLLLLDGDMKPGAKLHSSKGKLPFCARDIGRLLAARARESTGAGRTFSFAAVFSLQEFESWILAGHPRFAGNMEGQNVENAPRDAKGKIREINGKVYSAMLDQQPLTAGIDLDFLIDREPKVRSFQRLDHAVKELIEAVRTEQHVATPNVGTAGPGS